MKIGTLQCDIQRLRVQTRIETLENIVSPSVTLFKKGTHVERARSVLSVDKCAKMVATITKLPFFTEEVPVLVEVRNFLLIDIWTLLQTIMYHNYTVAACNPL